MLLLPVIYYYKEYEDGTILCVNCEKRYDYFRSKVRKYYNKDTKNILTTFIEKYGMNPSKNDIDNLILLLNGKCRINIEPLDFPDIFQFIKGKIDEERRIQKFESELLYHKDNEYYCSICNGKITKNQFEYSLDKFHKALCSKHQDEKKISIYAKQLYDALIQRGVECELEAGDGHKHVDIVIPSAKLYIEMDGKQHSTNPDQLKTDLQRDAYSYKNGYHTKRYTNQQIKENLDEIADTLSKVAKDRMK
ncbi:MAG: DUF559 domain-containing protein [Candidatus Thermoplasmatota archaeon]|nr:DUF559 domain-containing protein [Candidatus Thermoplasmatota archaeon]